MSNVIVAIKKGKKEDMFEFPSMKLAREFAVEADKKGWLYVIGTKPRKRA